MLKKEPDRLWSMLLEHLEAREVPLVERAYRLANEAHHAQVRDGGRIPYITHPLRVALLLANAPEGSEPELIAIALLHDVLEDSPLRPDGIRRACGVRVSEAVQQLTKPPAGDGEKAQRDATYYAGVSAAPLEVRLVKCADRLDNLRSMKALDDPERLARYIDETIRHLLPIAAATSPSLHEALLAECDSRR